MCLVEPSPRYSPSRAHLHAGAVTRQQPGRTRCAQNKFNICHGVKWLCSRANEKAQTFGNGQPGHPPSLPAEEKASLSPYFFCRESLAPCHPPSPSALRRLLRLPPLSLFPPLIADSIFAFHSIFSPICPTVLL